MKVSIYRFLNSWNWWKHLGTPNCWYTLGIVILQVVQIGSIFILVSNKLPPNLASSSNGKYLSDTIFVGQEFRGNLAGWFWVWAVVLCRPNWAWRIWLQNGTLPWLASWFWLLAGGLSSSPQGLLHRAAWASSYMASSFPPIPGVSNHFPLSVPFRVKGDHTCARNPEGQGHWRPSWTLATTGSPPLVQTALGLGSIQGSTLILQQWKEFNAGQMGEWKITLKKHKGTQAESPLITGPALHRTKCCFKQLGKKWSF